MFITSPKCILVVDDDDMIRAAIAESLELEGYRVLTAGDGRAALTVIRATRPDVIVLDLMMPGMDGWAFLEQWRLDDLCGDTSVLVMSAEGKLGVIASDLRVQAFLAKPFDLDVLLSAIDDLLCGASGHRSMAVPC